MGRPAGTHLQGDIAVMWSTTPKIRTGELYNLLFLVFAVPQAMTRTTWLPSTDQPGWWVNAVAISGFILSVYCMIRIWRSRLRPYYTLSDFDRPKLPYALDLKGEPILW
jgi:hypothetical protein